MIINDKEALNRLNSPMNLMNRLRRADNNGKAMDIFGLNRKSVEVKEEVKISFNPFQSSPVDSTALIPSSTPSQVPALENILEDHESQIRLGLAHDKAIELLNRSVDMLAIKLEDVKADRLPQVISAASKTIESIRRERSEAVKNNKERDVHYHFYVPTQKKVEDFKIIDVT